MSNQYLPTLRPQLACKVNFYPERMILSQDGREFAFQLDSQSGEGFLKLFSLMDGTRSLSQLQQLCSPDHPEAVTALIQNLDQQGLLDDAAPLQARSGRDILPTLEDLAHELINQSDVKNPFWQCIQLATLELSPNLIYGFAIEHYHFFSQNGSLFSPVLSFQGAAKVQDLINELYIQTRGQEQFFMKALNSVGISSEDLTACLPLPGTMAMINGLAFWANFEPIFYLSILGVLVNGMSKTFEIYLCALEKLEVDICFIEPIKQLINTQLEHKQITLARSIFQPIPHIDEETEQRLREQTYLFVEMYGNFYAAIGQHYASTPYLLRRISAI